MASQVQIGIWPGLDLNGIYELGTLGMAQRSPETKNGNWNVLHPRNTSEGERKNQITSMRVFRAHQIRSEHDQSIRLHQTTSDHTR